MFSSKSDTFLQVQLEKKETNNQRQQKTGMTIILNDQILKNIILK